MVYGASRKLINKKQIALLHVAKSKLGLDEGNYRSILSLHGGVSSSKELTVHGFNMVMKYMQRIGFEAPAFEVQKRHIPDPKGIVEPAQMSKINTLYVALGMDSSDRRQGICNRVIKKPWKEPSRLTRG